MKSLDNKIIIDGIFNQDQFVLKSIYVQFFPLIKSLVINNNGTEQDAKDVFQEGIIMIYRKIKEGNLNLTSPFKSYIYSVCRLIWIKQMANKKDNAEKLEIYKDFESVEEIEVDEYEKNEQ